MLVLGLTRRIAGGPVDLSQWREGSWDTATRCVYTGEPRGMTIEGFTYPLMPGKVIDEPTMFAMIRDGELRSKAFPIDDGVASDAGVARSGQQHAKRQRPKHSLTPEAHDGAVSTAEDRLS